MFMNRERTIRVSLCVSVTCLFPLLCWSLAAGCAAKGSGFAASDSQTGVLPSLLPVLKREKKAGRINYEATCSGKSPNSIKFPKINVQSASRGNSALAEIREMFESDSGVEVSEDQDGVISIQIGTIASSVLKARIARVEFNKCAQYNPALAIASIMSTDEALAALQASDMRPLPRVANVIIAEPRVGLPHLPASLRNLTVDDALASVAQTFGGIVAFGACKNRRWYWIDFSGGASFGDSR